VAAGQPSPLPLSKTYPLAMRHIDQLSASHMEFLDWLDNLVTQRSTHLYFSLLNNCPTYSISFSVYDAAPVEINMEIETKDSLIFATAMPKLQKDMATSSSKEISSETSPQHPTSTTGSFIKFLTTKALQVSQFFASHSNNWWLSEIFATIISVLAMLTLIGILHNYNGRVVQHLRLGITLNGLVAALSTICRTALMIPVTAGISQAKWHWFSPKAGERHLEARLRDLETFDSASRGTWGSLKLLWMMRARYESISHVFVLCRA
jgi:Protein of unknown function (DUF3176)